jgi:hypothetical protein
MALQTKRALMIALLMATSFSQGGHGMDEGDISGSYGPPRRAGTPEWRLPNLSGFKKTFFMWGATALLNADPSSAWQIKLGPAFPVNRRSVEGFKYPSDVAAVGLPNGNLVLAWGERLRQGGPENVVGQIFDPQDGMAVTGKFNVSTVPIPASASFSVGEGAIASCGKSFGITWDNSSSIFLRIFSEDGEPVADPFAVNQQSAFPHLGGAMIACLSNGNFAVGWSGTDLAAGKGQTAARIFSEKGKPVTDEFNINQDAAGIHFGSHISSLRTSFFATFLTFSPLSRVGFNETNLSSKGNARRFWFDGTGTYTLKGRLFWPNGTAQSDEVTINEDETMPTSAARSAALTANDNTLVTIYSRYDESVDEQLLLGRTIKAGVPIGSAFPISNTGAPDVTSFSITALNEMALVGWSVKDRQGKESPKVRLVAESGPLTDEVALAGGMGNATTVTSLASGGGLGIWGTVDGSNYTNNYARTVVPSNTTETPTSTQRLR